MARERVRGKRSGRLGRLFGSCCGEILAGSNCDVSCGTTPVGSRDPVCARARRNLPWSGQRGQAVAMSRKWVIRTVGLVVATGGGIALGWMFGAWDHTKPSGMVSRAIEVVESQSAPAPSDNPLEALHVSDDARNQPAGAPARSKNEKPGRKPQQ